jgi:diguanylate cyclase (GGDEF)-like protein
MRAKIAAFFDQPNARTLRRLCACLLGAGMLLLAFAYTLLERNLTLQSRNGIHASEHVAQERLASQIVAAAAVFLHSGEAIDRERLLGLTAALERSVDTMESALARVSAAPGGARPLATAPSLRAAEMFIADARRLAAGASRDDLIRLGNVAKPALVEALHEAALFFLADTQRQIRALTIAKYFVLAALFILALGELLFVVRPLTRALDRAGEHLRRLAEEDGLTGLLTRGAFFARAGAVLVEAKAKRQVWAVVLFDIDRMRALNHCFGAGGGNAAIAHAAAIIRAAAPADAIAARWDGDEIILLLRTHGLQETLCTAEAIRRRIQETVCPIDRAQAIHLTASLGLAVLDPARETLTEAVLRADGHLRRAKLSGRNRTLFGLEDAAAGLAA